MEKKLFLLLLFKCLFLFAISVYIEQKDIVKHFGEM